MSRRQRRRRRRLGRHFSGWGSGHHSHRWAPHGHIHHHSAGGFGGFAGGGGFGGGGGFSGGASGSF